MRSMRILSTHMLLFYFCVFCVLALKEKTNGATGEMMESKRKSEVYLEKIAKDITDNFLKLSKPDNGQPPVVDLVFALDASSSSSVDAFDYQRDLVAALLDGFSISPSGTRVSIVSCSWSYSHPNFYLNKHVNKECIMAWIPMLRYQGGDRALGICLSVIKNSVLKRNAGMRSKSKKVVFVVSSGKSWNGVFPQFPANWMKKHDVEIFGLTIGQEKNALEQLQGIATEPVEKHVFWVKKLKEIPNLLTLLNGKGGFPSTCQGSEIVYDECERMCSCRSGRRTRCKRVRNDLRSMKNDERRRFIKVLKIVATKEPFKSQFYNLVSKYKNFFLCLRKRSVFLPWHRVYLLKLENLLRQVDCRVTLPYWDWTRASRNPWNGNDPVSIWSNVSYGLGGDGKGPSNCVWTGPFRKGKWNITVNDNKTTCLKRHFRGNPPNAQTAESVLSLPWKNFSDFEDKLRTVFYHSVACDNIGGHVCSREAAQTPEFILITCFVDKLWGQWQNISDFHRDTGFPVVSTNLPGFYLTYVGDVLRLDRQPGCVNVIYDQAT